jgi:hypothetical protein
MIHYQKFNFKNVRLGISKMSALEYILNNVYRIILKKCCGIYVNLVFLHKWIYTDKYYKLTGQIWRIKYYLKHE